MFVVIMTGQTVLQHLTVRLLHVTKNKLPVKDKMNSSNNNIYWCKCYLNVFKIVADKMRSNRVSYANMDIQ